MIAGRPPVYTGLVLEHIIELVGKHGLSKTMHILNGDVRFHEEALLRDSNIVPEPLGICYPTLQRLARQRGLTFKRGRPKG